MAERPGSPAMREMRRTRSPEVLLDAIEDSSGVRFRPSQVNDLVRLLENDQEAYFDAGMAWHRDRCVAMIVDAALGQLGCSSPRKHYSEAQIRSAFARAIAKAKDDAEVPF